MGSPKTNPGDIPGRLIQVLGGPVTVDLSAAAVYPMYRNVRPTMLTHVLFQNFSAFPTGSIPPPVVLSWGFDSSTPTELYSGAPFGGGAAGELVYDAGDAANSGAFLDHLPIIPLSVQVTTTVGGAAVAFTDDGAGVLTGGATLVSGTIDYATGALDIEFTGAAQTAVLGAYSYFASGGVPCVVPQPMVDTAPYAGGNQAVYLAVVTGVTGAGTVQVTMCGAVLP